MKCCKQFNILALFLLLVLFVPQLSFAAFPERPITVIFGFAAGGTSDASGRILAFEMEKILGQPINIVNKGGSGGALAVGDLLIKPTDGYTIAAVTSTIFTMEPNVRELRFKLEDMTMLGAGCQFQTCFATGSNRPYNNMREMLDWAKANKKSLTCASLTSVEQYYLRYLAAKESVEIRPVPFKGGGETLAQVLGDHVDFGFFGGVEASYVKSGRMKHLLTTGGVLYQFPDAMTPEQLGYPELNNKDYVVWFAKNGVPAEVVKVISDALLTAASKPEVQKMIVEKCSLAPTALTGAETLEALKTSREKYKMIVDAVDAAEAEISAKK